MKNKLLRSATKNRFDNCKPSIIIVHCNRTGRSLVRVTWCTFETVRGRSLCRIRPIRIKGVSRWRIAQCFRFPHSEFSRFCNSRSVISETDSVTTRSRSLNVNHRDMKKGRVCIIFAPFFLLLFFVSPSATYALTTFGKTNPQNTNQNPPPPPTPVGKARECKFESDCAGIQNTTCMADPRDGRTRCLCGDYTAPLNGACTNKYKAMRTPCNEDSECTDGAHCVQPNNSTTGRRCYCQEGYYEESPLVCSGSSSILVFHMSIFLAFLSLLKTTDI